MKNTLRNAVYEKLDKGFTKEDLDLLVFRLGIEETLDNSSQKTLIKELIIYLEKRDMKPLPQVIKLCQEINDTVDWSEIEDFLNKYESKNFEKPKIILPELNNIVKKPKPVRSWLVQYLIMLIVVVLVGTELVPLITLMAGNLMQKTHFKVFRDVLKDDGQAPEMIMLPAGKFMMGSNSDYLDEKPIHEVAMDSFAISKYEVTIGEFKAFVKATSYKTEAEKGGGCHVWTESNAWTENKWRQKPEFNWKKLGFTQMDTHPVSCVSWNDAVAYTDWLSQQTGKKYHLPTEAEWEYAARADNQGKNWYFGDDENQLRDYAWYDENSDNQTHSVGEKKANQWGLHDTAGNVWEWTCSDYQKYDIGKKTVCSENTNKTKSLRGGSWSNYAPNCRTAFRSYNIPSVRSNTLGFRVALKLL